MLPAPRKAGGRPGHSATSPALTSAKNAGCWRYTTVAGSKPGRLPNFVFLLLIRTAVSRKPMEDLNRRRVKTGNGCQILLFWLGSRPLSRAGGSIAPAWPALRFLSAGSPERFHPLRRFSCRRKTLRPRLLTTFVFDF